MTTEWDELERLCREIEETSSGAADRRERLRSEREALQPALEQIERFWQELAPEQALEQVRDRLLGGSALVQRVTAVYGLERVAALVWPAYADPRPELAAAKGEYRVQVLLGLNERGRPRIRVTGAKRLEAILPVAPDKFRAVLLGAVRAPEHVAIGDAEAEAPPESARVEQAAAVGEEPPAERPTPPPPDEPIPMGPAPGNGGEPQARAED
jgi:hypothetical protein